MRVAVLIGPVEALPRVDAGREDAVVTRALQRRIGEFAEPLFRGGVLPHQEGAEVALALDGTVQGVGPLERRAIRTRLHVDPAEGHLRLPHAHAVGLRLVEPDVAVEVTHLQREVARARRAVEVTLHVEREVVGDVALEHQPPPAQHERLVAVHGPVCRHLECRARWRPGLAVAELGVAAELQPVVPRRDRRGARGGDLGLDRCSSGRCSRGGCGLRDVGDRRRAARPRRGDRRRRRCRGVREAPDGVELVGGDRAPVAQHLKQLQQRIVRRPGRDRERGEDGKEQGGSDIATNTHAVTCTSHMFQAHHVDVTNV